MRILRLALVALLILATGCLKVDQTLSINDDGSGSLQVEYSVSEQAISQLRAMRKLTQQMAAATGEQAAAIPKDDRAYMLLDPQKQSLTAELEKLKPYGVTVDELEVETRNARRNVRVQLRFKSLAEVAKSDWFVEYGFLLYKGPRGNYVFDRPASGTGDDSVMDFSSPEMVRLLNPLLTGFSVISKVRTPGVILRTNAHRHSQHVAQWQFDFDEDPNALVGLQNQRMLILFEGRGVTLPTIKPESAE